MKVNGREVEISRADKVLFPDDGITKADLAEYYLRIADVMLPYMADRPVVMHRFPDGIEGEGFYHKDMPDHFPPWIRHRNVTKEGGTVRHVICDDAATLVYLADQACITFHIWLSKAPRLHHPDRMIFDLDPPGDDFALVRQAALGIADILEGLELEPFVMTTGSRGLHIVVPLDARDDFDTVRGFARGVARLAADRNPDELTIEARKSKRRGRLFLDIARNAYAQTAVAPYAIRPRPGAPVATPLDWEEVRDNDLTPTRYTIGNIFKRLGQKDDPWARIDSKAGSVSASQKRLEGVLPQGD